MTMSIPKITVITPVYNQVDYIEATILSVIEQNYENIEYIIIDGGSTDGTLDIIKKYEHDITTWISEPDEGMYDALGKGFEMSKGEIMCWINSDDILYQGALHTMARLFKDLPHVSWVQGLQSYIDLEGSVIYTGISKRFSLLKFLNHDYKWIQQESTFWRRSLWDKVGSRINNKLKLAGDFELWFRFSQYERLFNCSLPIGAWRKREGQLSATQMKNYIKEIEQVIDNYIIEKNTFKILKQIKILNSYINILEKIKVINTDYLISKRAKYFDIVDNEIYYSYMDKKFKTP